MELKFIGRGAAFNPKEGNTSAYFIENDELFLIDCGENVFTRIIERNLFNSIKTINLLITHTHSDHIGSIGSLVLYAFYNQMQLNIILPEPPEYLKNLEQLLEIFGCDASKYKLVSSLTYDNKYRSFKSIRFVKTNHKKDLVAYSIIFETNDGVVYYSGDTNDPSIIISLIKENKLIDKLYIDTTNANFKDNVHLYIGYLKEIIPENLKKSVYCMHFNNDECLKEAIMLGFNIAESGGEYEKNSNV